jgi:plasmid stabilization system protein ParE
MVNGYEIRWTDHALDELNSIYEYLIVNFTERELRNLAVEIEHLTYLISINPYLFQESEIKKGVRKAVILKFNTLYYRIENDTIEILSFFSNRQSQEKLKL